MVPAGHLRFFASHIGRKKYVIRLGWKRDRSDRSTEPISVRDAFVRSGFLTVQTPDGPDDAAEDEFQKVENRVIRAVRAIDVDNVTGDDRGAALAAMSLLLARSLRAEALGDRAAPDVVSEMFERSRNDRRLRREFARQAGRQPRPGEVEEVLTTVGRAWLESRDAHVSGMLHLFNSAQEYMRRFNVELLSSRRAGHGFVTSDNPVTLTRGDGMIEVESERTNFAMGDADRVFAPIRRDLVVSLTSGRHWQGHLATREVVMINNAMWRGAFECVGAHPGEDWRMACGGVRSRPE